MAETHRNNDTEIEGPLPDTTSRRGVLGRMGMGLSLLAAGSVGVLAGGGVVLAGGADGLIRRAIQPSAEVYRQLIWQSAPLPVEGGFGPAVQYDGDPDLQNILEPERHLPANWGKTIVIGTNARSLLAQQQELGLRHQALAFHTPGSDEIHVGTLPVGQLFSLTGETLDTMAVAARIGPDGASVSMGPWDENRQIFHPAAAGVRELGRATVYTMFHDYPGVIVG